MEVNLVVEGLKFMVLGMTTVFLFLMLMIFVLGIISKITNKYFPHTKLTPARINKKNNTTTQNDGALVAAITASIQEFKKQK